VSAQRPSTPDGDGYKRGQRQGTKEAAGRPTSPHPSPCGSHSRLCWETGPDSSLRQEPGRSRASPGSSAAPPASASPAKSGDRPPHGRRFLEAGLGIPYLSRPGGPMWLSKHPPPASLKKHGYSAASCRPRTVSSSTCCLLGTIVTGHREVSLAPKH
jgi:hypothetical protein